MLETISHGDVTELRFTTWRSTLSRMRVSAFVARGLLVDSSFPAAAPDLVRWLATHPVQGAALTHYHEDHSGGAAALARCGTPLWMSDETQSRVAAPAPIFFYRRFSWGSPEPLRTFTPFVLPTGFAAIATPGHSNDHHVIWDAETRTVFGGDLFVGVKVRVAHATEDARATAASLRRILALQPRRFYDAHRGPLPDPVAFLSAKADWIETTVARAERFIADGLDDERIARQLLGSDRFGRWYTAGDYTMANWIAGVRRGRSSAQR